MIGRSCGVQVSWVSDPSLSLTWQWLDREDHAFALPSDTCTKDRPPRNVKLGMIAEHLLPAPVAATGLKVKSLIFCCTDAGPCTIVRSAATSIRWKSIHTARALPKVLRGVQ